MTQAGRVQRLEALAARQPDAAGWALTAARIGDRGRELIEKGGADMSGLDIAELTELEAALVDLAARTQAE
ncbi:MAG TPA: hypothetical protein VGI95_17285 [Caulobacteraceae bacterium]|jgi:hypothetical protein